MDKMSVIAEVRQELKRKKPGVLLTYKDFVSSPEQVATVIKSLSTFYRQGILSRLSKGLYYKPQETQFGPVLPDPRKIITQLLNVQKQNISYQTGINIFNHLGLTTQVSKDYVIATDKPRSPINIGVTQIKFVESKFKETIKEPYLLQLLDALVNIKKMPDTSPEQICLIIQGHLKKLDSSQCNQITQYSLSYPPSVRALLGMLFDSLNNDEQTRRLYQSLNPLSSYNVGLISPVFNTSFDWKIYEAS